MYIHTHVCVRARVNVHVWGCACPPLDVTSQSKRQPRPQISQDSKSKLDASRLSPAKVWVSQPANSFVDLIMGRMVAWDSMLMQYVVVSDRLQFIASLGALQHALQVFAHSGGSDSGWHKFAETADPSDFISWVLPSPTISTDVHAYTFYIMYTSIRAYLHVCIHAYMYICIYICWHAHTCASLVCMVCVYIRICL